MSDLYSALLLGVIAICLLIYDRVVRINPFLVKEGFQVRGAQQSCGVDMPPCEFPTRCINGFCCNADKRQLLDRNPLPVLP